MLKNIKKHLSSHVGSEYTEKIVLIAIVFTIGAIFIELLSGALTDSYKTGVKQLIQNIFNI